MEVSQQGLLFILPVPCRFLPHCCHFYFVFFCKKDNVIKLLLALLPNCLTGFAPEPQFRIFVFMSPLTCSLYICATDVYTVHVCVKLV